MSTQDETVEIALEGLEVRARHGLYPEERRQDRVFRFDIGLTLRHCPACASDDIAGTVDYAAVADCVAGIAEGNTFHLLEKLAAAAAEEIVSRFPLVARARVRVVKARPPGMRELAAAVVTVTRERPRERGL